MAFKNKSTVNVVLCGSGAPQYSIDFKIVFSKSLKAPQQRNVYVNENFLTSFFGYGTISISLCTNVINGLELINM